MDKEFEEKCLQQRTVVQPPGVINIEDIKIMRQLAEQHHNNSAYFLESAHNLIATSTSLAGLILGYFAMEHKANQLLVLQGYKVESHLCTQMGLSRILQRKDLAKQLSDIFTLRQNIGYRLTLIQNEENKKEAEHTFAETTIPFIMEVDKLITLLSQQ